MDKKVLLEKLRQEMIKANLPFKEAANNLVFGEGNPDAKVFFLGEAPGKNEDLTGKPFVGQAGKILDQLIESIGLKREDVFISSVLHYRPPKNRDPKPKEIDSEAPFVDKQISIINPKIIVPLGRFSLKKFLPEQTISSAHGNPQRVDWQGKTIVVVPMYHPAAVLYKRSLLQVLLKDFLEIKKYLTN